MTITGYKWLTADMRSVYKDIQWVLGEWRRYEGQLELCNSGFHACRTALQSLDYRYGSRLFLVEARGGLLSGDDKFVCKDMRLVRELPGDRIVLDFMIAVLKNCLFRYENKYPDGFHPRNVLDALEAYKQDPCDYTRKLIGAARAAARAAAGSAARAAARAAAGDAAGDAARAAAWAVAGDAAGNAARAAAGDAARAAARAAAWAAAGNAAGNAARAAERGWQEKKLEQIIRKWS